MDVWRTTFLYDPVVYRFHVNLPGRILYQLRYTPQNHAGLLGVHGTGLPNKRDHAIPRNHDYFSNAIVARREVPPQLEDQAPWIGRLNADMC